MPITIYHCPASPPSRVALLAARVVGIEISIEEIDLFSKEQLSSEFIKINPQHTVPTIDDNGFIMWESRAIAGYFVHQYSKSDSLYPRNPQLKAVVDQRLYFDCTTFYPRWRAITFPIIYLGERTVPEEKKKNLNEALGLVETFLHGRNWLAGDSVTIADISLYPTISTIAAVGWDLSPYSKLLIWLDQCQKLPGADENEEGAKQFKDIFNSKIEPNQIP